MAGKPKKKTTAKKPLKKAMKKTVKKKPATETEAQFQKRLIDYAQLNDWIVAHFTPCRSVRGGKVSFRTPVSADGKGFPDLVMACRKGKRGVVYAELKRDKSSKPQKEQVEWLEILGGNSENVYLWRPDDWPEIEEVIGRR